MWHLLASILLLIPTQSLYSFTVPQLSEQILYEHALKTRKEKRQCAAMIQALNTSKAVDAATDNAFITDTEIKELEISWLIDTLDYCQTAFGRCHMQQSKELITGDVAAIQERQRIEQLLCANPELLQKIQSMLHAIGQRQDSFFAYFDPSNRLNQLVQDFYFTGSSVDWLSKKAATVLKKGNNHTSTLNLGVFGSIVRRCDSLFISLCKQSMADELIKIALGMSTTLNLDAFLFDNIVNMAKGHMPWFKSFNPQTYDGNHYAYSTIMQEGTFGDKIGAYVCGSTASDTSIGFKYLPINWRWNLRKQSDFTSWDKVPWYSKAIAAVSLFGWTLYKDYRMVEDGKDSVKRIQLLFKTMRSLRMRLMRVSQTVKIIKELSTLVATYPEMKDCAFAQQLQYIAVIAKSEKFKELCALLKKATFSRETDTVYNYGVVLRAHGLMNEIKQDFIPVLAAVGEFDAYCSVATLLKRHQSGPAQFSFVDFKESQEPFVSLHNCWVPLISPTRVVTNDIMLGTQGWGNKVIITGPNGGGKSTYLKALGHSVYLAHTFGIVPASQGTMSPYAALRTCFHPRESLSEDMSQFMVEKRCMDTLEQYVLHDCSKCNTMLLIDEPYRGTVDAESAERIYAFGTKVAQAPYASVVIATHVYKPIQLAKATQGLFTNCQVIINELGTTLFERTFKVIPDVAYWWFDNADRRARFVDWLAQQ